MILSVDELMRLPDFAGETESIISGKLEALELMIRAYTHNNFQNRRVRFVAKSRGIQLLGSFAFFRVGDTIQISQSDVNDGLYQIVEIAADRITVNEELFETTYNLVTKIEYPADIKAGVLELLKWDVKNRKKIGIKSETLSRHSVTYYDMDASNQVMGYPVSLLGFLKPYMKARF